MPVAAISLCVTFVLTALFFDSVMIKQFQESGTSDMVLCPRTTLSCDSIVYRSALFRSMAF